jgi:hypothetical protein
MATPETNIRRFLALAVLLTGVTQAQVPELETIFYGRIVNRTTAQEYQLTSGTLKVTVTGEGFAPLELTAPIRAHANGKYSYVLKVPHQAKSLDLTVEPGKLPLFVSESGLENTSMEVDGHAARPFGNGATAFVVSQAKRGGLHRLDLEVSNALEDTDGDGIPDWWEDLYGLDKQDRSDAAQRWGDNRYTYREAFRLGLNPLTDDRVPELLTAELMVMAKGATGLLLRTVASASTPSQVGYRLLELPSGGEILLRNARPDPKRPHQELKVGATFTQADVDAGRVEFVHQDAAVASTRFKVALTNNNPAIEAVEREVELLVFSPDAVEGRAGERWLQAEQAGGLRQDHSAFDVWRRRASDAFGGEWTGGTRRQDWIAAFLLARLYDYTVWDGSMELPVRALAVPSADFFGNDYSRLYVRRFGRARNHILFAGQGVTRLDGGMSDDVLVAGRGETTLRGHGGADFFVASEGTTIIEDFKVADGDILDLSVLLKGWSGALAEKVRVEPNAGNTLLRIALGAGKQAVVVLQGLSVSSAQLETWRSRGRLFRGEMPGSADLSNRAPVAVADEGYIVAGEPILIPVLANDYDLDGDAVSLASVTQGALGSVEIFGEMVAYTPGPGFAGSDAFTYRINDGRGGFTNGRVSISYPYPAAAGSYRPILLGEDGRPIGQLHLLLQRGGGFTVTLRVDGVNATGRGQFDKDGFAVVTLRVRGRTVELRLVMDLTDPTFPMTGSLLGLDEEGTLNASVASAQKSVRADTAKRYTVVADLPETPANLAGHSFVAVHLSRRHLAKMAGRLADGTPFTGSAVQDKNGSVFWSVALYRRAGWMMGQLTLGDTSRSTGVLTWSKPAGSGPAFVLSLDAVAASYVAPSVAAVSALDFPNLDDRRADLRLSGGGLPQISMSEVTFHNRDVVRSLQPDLKLKLNRNTGVFSGRQRVDGTQRFIHGVLRQDVDTGHGFFISGGMTGSVLLQPK